MDELVDLELRADVDATRWFVKDQHLGFSQQPVRHLGETMHPERRWALVGRAPRRAQSQVTTNRVLREHATRKAHTRREAGGWAQPKAPNHFIVARTSPGRYRIGTEPCESTASW